MQSAVIDVRDSGLANCRLGGIFFALAHVLFAAVSLDLARTGDGIPIIWPSSGLLVGGLLLLPRRQRIELVATSLPASIVVYHVFGASFGHATIFAIANMIEAFVAAKLAHTRHKSFGRFDHPKWVLRYAGAALAGALVSTSISAIPTGHVHDAAFICSWFATVLLGILIAGSIVITGVRAFAGLVVIEAKSLPLAAVSLLAVASVFVAFFQRSYPLLFLPLAAGILVTYVAGVAGSVAMVCLVTTVGTIAVTSGMSPITFTEARTDAIYFFQFYLFIVFASSLPLASLLARLRANMQEIAIHKAQHVAAQTFAKVGHWRYCLNTEKSEWSDGMFDIYGLDPVVDEPRNLEQGSILPNDCEVVRSILENAVVNKRSFTLEARIERADGEVRHVESLGDVELKNGRPVALFGILKDVTDHTAALEELEREKMRAEELAIRALMLSETDQLTSVANRRKLLNVLEIEMARSERSGSDLSIVMIDVDHFKAINDQHGHAAGDEVLQKIAAVSEGELRKGDLFGRLGGEEFLAILTNTSGPTAMQVAERLRACCVGLRWPNIIGLKKVSISLGVAVHQNGTDETFLLQAADAALYESKNTGRNRLTLAA